MRHIDETACGGRKSTSGQPFLLASLFNGYFLPSLNDNIIHCEIGEFEPISTNRYLDRFFDDNIPSTHLLTSLLIENVHVIYGPLDCYCAQSTLWKFDDFLCGCGF